MGIAELAHIHDSDFCASTCQSACHSLFQSKLLLLCHVHIACMIGVPALLCCGGFVCIFPLQKADGSSISVLPERKHGPSLDQLQFIHLPGELEGPNCKGCFGQFLLCKVL